MSIDAMKQALGALDWAADHITPEKPINCDCPVCVASDVLRRAIDEAERLEKQPTKFFGPGLEEMLNSAGFYKAEKQEPVAWKNVAMRIGEELSSVGPDGYYDMTAEQWLGWAMDQQPRGKNSLAAPPQRQPLTENAGLLEQNTMLDAKLAELERINAQLLEALEAAVYYFDAPGDGCFSDAALVKARAAIAAAKGEA